jgi:Ca2+-binding RTX toxin-like protein
MGTVTGSHEYGTAGGVFTITLTLFDDDGGTATRTISAFITGVGTQGGVLNVIGTNKEDRVRVNLQGRAPDQQYNVRANFLPGGDNGGIDVPAAGITEILLITCGGDDRVQVSDRVSVPTIIDVGMGDDHADGGSGPNILIGGDGEDMLQGGRRRDVIIGGRDSDRIVGQGGDDLLIAGLTAFDGDLTALQAIADEWNSADSYANRVAHLRGTLAGGLNGTVFLKGDDELGGVGSHTVFDDGAVDRLTGASGMDWFLTNTVADSSALRDIITDHRGGELVIDIDLDLL